MICIYVTMQKTQVSNNSCQDSTGKVMWRIFLFFRNPQATTTIYKTLRYYSYICRMNYIIQKIPCIKSEYPLLIWYLADNIIIYSSPLSTEGPMHIAMELRWLPCANWLREGRCEQMTYPWATIWKRGPIAQLVEHWRTKSGVASSNPARVGYCLALSLFIIYKSIPFFVKCHSGLKHKIWDLLSAFPNFIANVSCFASSSAKSAGVFQTNALSLEQCGCNFILGNTAK